MITIKQELDRTVSKIFGEAGYDKKYAIVTESKRPDLSQYQCNGALAAAKQAGKNPREIAAEIAEKLEHEPVIKDLSIAGPGFININISDDFLGKLINKIAASDKLGYSEAENPENIVIDFGGPNVAKPMHVGHLRSAIIGDSLQRLFRFCGHNVISDNHMGDWGTQMGMLICELRREKPDLPYFDSGQDKDYPQEPPITIGELEEMYPRASKRCKSNDEDMAEALKATDELQRGNSGYTALWKHFVSLSVETLKEDFSRLGVEFDYWLGESFYSERMAKLVERLTKEGFTEINDGATILPVEEESDKSEIPPILLVKSSGGFLYGTSDIATIEYRMEKFDADRILYVVDKRQGLHFKQVFRAVRKTEIVNKSTVLEHTGFGTVNGKDGKPFKTRAGGVMKLKDLISQVTQKAHDRMKEASIGLNYPEDEQNDIAEKVGLAALKFADLSNHRTSDYIFDLDKFTKFEGKTGPYLLYTAVRIKSILRKAADAGIEEGEITENGENERELLLSMAKFGDIIDSSSESYLPNYLCDYVYSLAQSFNRFYKTSHILNEEDKEKQSSWLSISKLCLRELETILNILGIGIPGRM